MITPLLPGCSRPGRLVYNVDVVQPLPYNETVIVDWPEEFDHWFTNVEKQGGRLLATTVAMLQALMDLPAKPTEESATFKRVRQARRHELWRVAHPFDADFEAYAEPFTSKINNLGSRRSDPWGKITAGSFA